MNIFVNSLSTVSFYF